MTCQQVTLSGSAEWPKVADAVIEAGAGILRWKPNINWGKDRGREPVRLQDEYPWFWENAKFTGDRVNDVHLTNDERRRARVRRGTGNNG